MAILDAEGFRESIITAQLMLEAKRGRLDKLRDGKSIALYGYGTRGQALAKQLQMAGFHPVICDSNPLARDKAAQAGLETAADVPAGLLMVIAAAQNQRFLLRRFPLAYSLVECLFSLNLINQCAPSQEFTADIGVHLEKLYAVYLSLEEGSRNSFLNLLRFRASLDVSVIEASRLPLAEMWTLPLEHIPVASLCDAGAYDGDTIRFLASRTNLRKVLAIEPNVALKGAIETSARQNGIELLYYGGGLWSHKCRLMATELLGGMVAVEEDASGDIPADALDNMVSESYDYVKFDIEGAEAMAMDGASRLMADAKVIALAAYHRPYDILHLADRLIRAEAEVDRNGSSRRLYFRHYSECFDDSIFYLF